MAYRNLEDSIIETVLESDGFNDAVSEAISKNLAGMVKSEIEDYDFSDVIQSGIESTCRTIDDVEERVSELRGEIERQNKEIAELKRISLEDNELICFLGERLDRLEKPWYRKIQNPWNRRIM